MANTYTLISSQTLASTAATVTFSSIPATYTDLCIKISARTNYANLNDTLSMMINNINSYVYSETWFASDGSTTQSANVSANNTLNGRYDIDGATATTNTFANTEIYIPNYNVATTKSISWTSVMENNSSTAYMNMLAGYINSTAAVTSVKFTSYSGSSFVAGSSFYLYGIKNS